MSIYKGSTKLGTIYHGSTKIGKVYKGSTLVYSGKEKNLIVKYTVKDGLAKNAAWYGFIDGLKYNAGEQNILSIYLSFYTEPYGIITSYSGNSISIKAENSTITYTKHGSRTVCGLPFVGFYDDKAQLYPGVDYFLVSPNAQVGDMAIRGGADSQGAGGIIISDDGSTISSRLYAWNGVSNFSTSFNRSQATNSFNYLYRG